MNTPLRTVQERVRKSAAKLDKELPGWHASINLHTLDMHQSKTCIWGQLENAGLDVKKIKTGNTYGGDIPDEDLDQKRGFYLPEYSFGRDGAGLLRRLWSNQVRKRLIAK